MYNSPGIPLDLKKASTALHMDMMDAVNLSLSANKTAKADELSAEWMIFPADRVDELRSWLTNKFKDDPEAPKEGDIIHSAWVVFTGEMLSQLFQETGIKAWKIEQHPGDAVFIPSRCPHMVRYYSLCLMIYHSFLSRSETEDGS